MRAVDRSQETYKMWMREDPDFHKQISLLREISRRARVGDADPDLIPDFPEFAERYLHQPLHTHQLRQWDVMNGREPRDMHEAIRFQKGRPNFLLFNMPPNHAKSTTWTMNYVTWRIHKNPNVRVIIVSKSQTMAKKFLGGIKQRLVDQRYREMQAAFAPEGGWRDPDSSWTATEIYVKGKGDGEKDPTVQALGLGGQIYGARADLIILDDVQVLANVASTDSHVEWVGQEVVTRPDEDGMVMVCATRVAPVDLSQTLRDTQFDDPDDETEDEVGESTPVWTYLAQPAVLEYSARPRDWKVLWPEVRGPLAMAKQRATIGSTARWALVYQQADVDEDSTFPLGAVNASVSLGRAAGLLDGDLSGHPEHGMAGMYVIAGVDPATVGHTAMIVYAVHRATGKRWILDGFNEVASPLTIRNKILGFTSQYKVQEWVVERNAFQAYLSRDEELLAKLHALGSRMTEHYTTSNKADPDFGVAAMAPLFLSAGQVDDAGKWTRHKGGGLIDLPSPHFARFVEQLVEQLVLWHPGTVARGQKTDLVMALWFCEIAALKLIGVARKATNHLPNPFAGRRELRGRRVINLDEVQARMLEAV